MYAAIELGGTKICCGIGHGNNEFIDTQEIETREPQSTLSEVIEYLRQAESQHGALRGLGLASFGPVDLNQDSATYGSILKTPKPNWSNYPLLQAMREQFDIPMAITTDVNAALLAEHRFGAARGVNNAVYVTVGTGVGAGVMVNGQLVNGFLHPEVGHIRIPTGGVKGCCPFHGDCLEGLASGPAIHARAGRAAQDIPIEHPVWNAVASNLGDMCTNLLMILSTQRIILGGGVMSKEGLLDKIKHQLHDKLNDYLPIDECTRGLDSVVVGASLPDGAGLSGALLIAEQATK